MAANGEVFEIKAEVDAVILDEYSRAKSILARQLPKGIDVKHIISKSDNEVERWGQMKIGQIKMIDWYEKRLNRNEL